MQTRLIIIVSLSSVHLPESSLHHCTTSLTRLDSTKRENTLIFALLNGPMLLFVYFLPFLIIISIIQIEKSVDGILGIQTRGRRIMAQTKPRSDGGLYLLNYSPFLLQPSSQPVIELPYVCFDVNCRFSWSSSCDAGRRVRRTRRQPTEKIGKRGAA